MKWYVDEEIDSQKHQDQTTQERPSLDGITTEVAHNVTNDSEEEVEVGMPLITIDKRQEVAPKRVRKQPVTRGNDFLWEV